MSAKTGIEWTDRTWNPTRGCSRVSPGCEHCYAETFANRFKGEGKPYEGLVQLTKKGPRWTGDVHFYPEVLAQPLSWKTLSWKKPEKVFVDSMSDLFHERFSDLEIAAVFGVMRATPQFTYQVLTKRAKRMYEWFQWVSERRTPAPAEVFEAAMQLLPKKFQYVLRAETWKKSTPGVWPLPNVWLGVSAETQKYASERVWWLTQTPAAVRFVSAEPLLGRVDLGLEVTKRTMATGDLAPCPPIDWVIVGSESGAGARPMDLSWAKYLVAQCRQTSTACYVKQIATALDRKGGSPAFWPAGEWPRQFPEKGNRA